MHAAACQFQFQFQWCEAAGRQESSMAKLFRYLLFHCLLDLARAPCVVGGRGVAGSAPFVGWGWKNKYTYKRGA